MLTRPNIFNYAKKELSQDAVICWLLECCHSDDDKYRQIGNAVPVGLARAIGETLVAVAKGEQEIVVKRIRGTGIHDRIQNAIRVGGTDKC